MSEELVEFHRFNAWANRSLLAAVRRLGAEELVEQRDGMYGSVRSVLAHLVQVESVYLSMMRDGRREPASAGSLEEIDRALEATGAGLIDLAGSAPRDATFHVPWFERDFTVRQGLIQVLSHSASHRADVNQWLPRFGVDSARQDYVHMVLEGG